MTQEELQKEYDKYKDNFDEIKHQIENCTVKSENYKGTFYEIFPFSFQRVGFKQGMQIENLNKIKSTNELYTYGFNRDNKIIEVKEGVSLKDQFYYQFLFYERDFIKSLIFDNNKTLQNVSFYFLENNFIKEMKGKGRMGGKEELYHYNENGVLKKISIKQIDRRGNESPILEHIFDYNADGSLKIISKSSPSNKDFIEIIYQV